MRSLLGFLSAAVLLAGLSAPAGATTVDWSGMLELELGAQGTAPGLGLMVAGGGTATVNSSTGGAVTQLAIPAGAFATTLSVPVYNQAPIVNLALVVSNAAITVLNDLPCNNFGHSAVGRGGMFLPAGTGPGAHGIFCVDGPFRIYGTGGLVGSSFVGILGTPGSPFANLEVPLTVIGGGSTVFAQNALLGLSVAAAGMGWLTGQGQVRYVFTTPGGNATFTTTLTETGTFTSQGGPTGMMRLVSPVSIQVGGAGALPLPSFARIDLSFVPEPQTLLLLGAAALGLAVYGRHRMRS